MEGWEERYLGDEFGPVVGRGRSDPPGPVTTRRRPGPRVDLRAARVFAGSARVAETESPTRLGELWKP